MSLELYGRTIDSIYLIDDDPEVRSTYEYQVEDLGIRTVEVDGPIEDLDSLMRLDEAEAAICDHHLTPNGYSNLNGVHIVARWYDRKFPSILCTKVDNTIDQIRPLRRRVPVLFEDVSELTPDALVRGLKTCVGEFEGYFSTTRRGWRTLVRVVDVDTESAVGALYVVVPAWDSRREIRLLFDALPDAIREVVPKQERLHAVVNIGAEHPNDLYFDEWEPS